MISISHISKTYPNPDGDLNALRDVSFDVHEGEFVTIFGPNGSGKSTLFGIISGLEKTTSGNVLLSGMSPENASIGFVFQNYNESMFPWLSVLDNVLFPLDVKKVDRETSLKKAETILKQIRLWEHRDKYLYQLSGGMRQLVAIARAFITNPSVLLMDEPCSALDYTTTKRIELELLSLWHQKKITTIVISHDIDEAIFLADRVIVLSPRPGTVKEIIQVPLARPRTLGMFSSREFFEIRSKVLKAFSYE